MEELKEKALREVIAKINNHSYHMKRKYQSLDTDIREQIYSIIDQICDDEFDFIAIDFHYKTPEQLRERVQAVKKFIKSSIKSVLEPKQITLQECITKIKSFKYYMKKKYKNLDDKTKNEFYNIVDRFCNNGIKFAVEQKEANMWNRLRGTKIFTREWIQEYFKYKDYLED